MRPLLPWALHRVSSFLPEDFPSPLHPCSPHSTPPHPTLLPQALAQAPRQLPHLQEAPGGWGCQRRRGRRRGGGGAVRRHVICGRLSREAWRAGWPGPAPGQGRIDIDIKKEKYCVKVDNSQNLSDLSKSNKNKSC